MCNLFTVRADAAEVAKHFGVDSPPDIAVPAETVRGTAGVGHSTAEAADVVALSAVFEATAP